MAEFRRLAKGFLCLALTFAAPDAVAANSPEVERGLVWLGQQVQPNGTVTGEIASVATPFQARAETAVSLKLLATLPAALVTSVGAETEDVCEFLARKAVVLSLAGGNTTQVLQALQSRQNPDGGFSPYAGYASNAYESAWAVAALNQLGHGPDQSANLARAYLRALQQADGGIGVGGDDERLIETALAVIALRSGDPSARAAAQAGVTFLKARQLADASWGSDVYLTASVWLAIETDISVVAERDRVKSYLKTAQGADGSWSGDPFLTALAVRALTADVTAQPPLVGSITGRIVEQGSAALLSNASVAISGAANPAPILTGADGRFSFANLAAGTYNLTITKAGYQGASSSVALAVGQQRQLADIALAVSPASGVIRGQIRKAADNTPLPDVLVGTNGSPSLTATTGIDGRYEIVNVPAASVQVTASKSGFIDAKGTATIAAGAALVFSPSLYATGTTPPTTGKFIGKVVAAGSGAALSGVSVKLDGTARATTAADGTFTVDLAVGSYAFEFGLTGYDPVRGSLIVTAGSVTDAGTVALSPARTTTKISGQVTKAGGAALSGATVKVDGGPSVTTGADGRYVLDNLAGTSFTLTVSAAGYVTQAVTLQVAKPSDIAQDFVLIAQGQAFVLLGAVQVAPASVGANAEVVATATLTNSSADSVALSLAVQARDALDKVVGGGIAVDANGALLGVIQVAPNAQITVRAKWNSGQYAPGSYALVLRAIAAGSATTEDPVGRVLGEARGAVTVTQELAFIGSVTADPPVLRVGSSAPVKLSAALRNIGNAPLPAQDYRLTIVNTVTSAEAYNQRVAGASVEVARVATLVFPEWMPAAAGNYRLQVSAVGAGAGNATATVFVGNSPAAAYTVDKPAVPIGNQAAKGRIVLAGIDPATSQITDPLAPLIRAAVQKAVTFNDQTAANWTVTNKCLGCHIQSQALVGGELTRSLTTFDAAQRNLIFSYLANGVQADGAIFDSNGGIPRTQTMLGLWALNAWRDTKNIAMLLSRAAEFVMSTQDADGSWHADHVSGWWGQRPANAAFNVKSLTEVHGLLKNAAPGSLVEHARNFWKSVAGVSFYLASDAQNNVYATHYFGGSVVRIRADGTVENWLTGLPSATGMAFAADGTLYVATLSGLFRRNADRTATRIVPLRGDAVIFGLDGNLWMTDSASAKVYRITPEGQYTEYLSGGLLNGPAGLAFGPTGDLFVANSVDRKILRVKPDKTVEVVVSGIGGAPRQLLRHVDGWLVGTSIGLFRYDDAWQGGRLTLGESGGLTVTPDGGILTSDDGGNVSRVVTGSIDVAAKLPPLDASIAKGVAWLMNDANIDNSSNLNVAHRLIGLAAARKHYPGGTPSATAMQATMEAAGALLKSRQRADGGWGLFTTSASDSMVTAQVFVALDALNPSAAASEVRKTIEWMLSRQRPDGSWMSENGILSQREGPTTWAAISMRIMLDRLGAIDSGLTVAFPPNVQMSNSLPAANTVQSLPSGETIYNWSFTGVTAAGRTIDFDLALGDMQPGENRAVSSEAYLSFRNTFTAETQKAAIAVPSIRGDAQLDLRLKTDQPAYPANAAAQLASTLTNRNPTAINGTLTVSVVDSSGALVAEALRSAQSIAAGATVAVPGTFNTGTTQVGRYKAKSILTDVSDRVLAQDAAEFDIIPDRTPLASSLTLDRAAYESRDLVTLNARVYNRASNVILDHYSVRETVTDALGTVVFSATRAILQIGANSFADLFFSFRLDNAAAGTYAVKQEVFDAAGALRDTQNASFKVQASTATGSSLRGMIAASPKEMQRGATAAFAFTVNNMGNSDYAALPLKVQVIEPVSQALLQSTQSSIALAQLATYPGSGSWASSSVPASIGTGFTNYLVVISATAGGRTLTLSQDRFAVADLQPFAFTPQLDVPKNSLRTSNTVTLKGIAGTAPIGVTGGMYSVNGGAYTSAVGSVKNGDTVSVQQMSSAQPSTRTTATLTVLDVSVPFEVTTLTPDTTPDPFSFEPQIGVPLSSVRTSNTVTITGIDTAVPVRITGGEYSVNGAPFTAAPGMINNGDTVAVRQTSSSSISTKTMATLTVSELAAAFEVTTLTEDRTPDAFTFQEQTGVPLESDRTSNAVTITGINVAVAIKVEGGTYNVNGGAFTNVAGTVKANDVASVRQVSSPSFATKTTATLTVSELAVPFTVTTKAVADVTTTPVISGDARLLVLVSCGPNGAYDAQTEDMVCTNQRSTFLEGYLTSLGVVHRIVTSNDDFKVELRSGRYDTYWLTGPVKKLHDELADELREIVFRGEALILDTVHDERNSQLDVVVGAKHMGKSPSPKTVTLSASFLPTGSFDVPGYTGKVELTTATKQASYSGGDAAIVSNAWGYGRSLLFAFDLTGTLQAQSASALLRSMLDQSLDFVAPAVPASFVGGAYVPLAITLRNVEPVAVDVNVTATLPPGFVLAAGAPPATLSGIEVKWTAHIAAASTRVFEWAVKTPETSGRYSIPIVVQQVYGTSVMPLGAYTIAIEVKGIDTQLTKLIGDLNALALTAKGETQARDAAVAKLNVARIRIGEANYEDAIHALIGGVDDLDNIISIDMKVHQATVGNVIKEVEWRWWSALLPCPATPPCRS